MTKRLNNFPRTHSRYSFSFDFDRLKLSVQHSQRRSLLPQILYHSLADQLNKLKANSIQLLWQTHTERHNQHTSSHLLLFCHWGLWQKFTYILLALAVFAIPTTFFLRFWCGVTSAKRNLNDTFTNYSIHYDQLFWKCGSNRVELFTVLIPAVLGESK